MVGSPKPAFRTLSNCTCVSAGESITSHRAPWAGIEGYLGGSERLKGHSGQKGKRPAQRPGGDSSLPLALPQQEEEHPGGSGAEVAGGRPVRSAGAKSCKALKVSLQKRSIKSECGEL